MKQSKKGRRHSKDPRPYKPLYWMPIITVLLCVLCAKLILGKKLPESWIEFSPRIICAVVSLLGSFLGAKVAPRKVFLWGMVNAVGYCMMLLLCNLLFFGETFSGIGKMILWILGGGFLGMLLGGMKKSKIA